jgi:hypothetical protein
VGCLPGEKISRKGAEAQRGMPPMTKYQTFLPPNTALRDDGYDTVASCVLLIKGGEEHIEWLFCSMRKTKKYIFVDLLTLKRSINEP